MINTVLRLFSAICLYILELYIWCFVDFCLLGFRYFVVVALLEMPKHIINYIRWESFNFGVKLLGASIIKPARRLNFVFRVRKFRSQLLEVFIGF